jgi:hypothetical protein
MRFLKGFLTGLVAVVWIAVRVHQIEKALRRPQPVQKADIRQAFDSIAEGYDPRPYRSSTPRRWPFCPVHGPTCIRAIRAVSATNGAH